MLQERSWGHLQCGSATRQRQGLASVRNRSIFQKKREPFCGRDRSRGNDRNATIRIALETNPKRVRNRAACTEAKEKDKRPAGHRPATRHRSWQTIQLG